MLLSSFEKCSIGEWEYSERVLALWASSQNSSERAEEANGSLPRFSRKSIAILRLLKTGEQHRRMGVFGKSIATGRVLKTLPREQKRRMGVFQGFHGRVLPFCDFSKLESSIGEWEYSERVLPLGECSKLFRESRRGERESSKVFTEEYCHSATSQNWRRRMAILFRENLGRLPFASSAEFAEF